MKNFISFLILAAFTVSCSDDDSNSNPVADACALLGITENTATVQNNPCAIAVSPAGYIAVSEFNGGYGTSAKIRIYTSYDNFKSGTLKQELTAIAPEAMAFDKDNNLYISETEQVAGIKIYDHIGDGAYAYKKVIQDDFNNPRGLAFDGQNRLYLADDGTGRIIRFNDPFNSDVHATIGNWDAGIKGLAINGNIMYVTNYNSNLVSRNVLKDNGTLSTLDAAVNIPKATDVSVNGNTVVITSYENNSVTVFSNCNFSDASKNTYTGKVLGTAFVTPNVLLTANLDTDRVKTFDLK